MSDAKGSSAPLIRDHLYSPSQVQIRSALWSVFLFIAIIAFGFAATLHFGNKLFFLASMILGLVAVFLVFAFGKNFSRKISGPKNRDGVIAAFEPFIQKISSAGFDAAVTHSIALIRISLSIAESQRDVFPIIDEAICFYMTRLAQITDIRNAVGSNVEIRNQFVQLQNSLENHMRKTQYGKVSADENKKIDVQVGSIQSRLDRIETIHRVALQMTMDLARLRFSCEELINGAFSPEEIRSRSSKLLHEQLEREKRMTPELLRIGIR